MPERGRFVSLKLIKLIMLNIKDFFLLILHLHSKYYYLYKYNKKIEGLKIYKIKNKINKLFDNFIKIYVFILNFLNRIN